MSAAQNAVSFLSVTKAFGKVIAVDDISFDIHKGELVTLLGPSGCGKTTTLRMIAGLELATKGTIEIADKDVTRLTATHRNVSMVFQSYALFPHMSVLENVCYGLSVGGMNKADAAQRGEQGLDQVGLSGFGNRLPSELSGGQQQRVAVARALVLEPNVLLFDEPLSNLDAKLRRHMREEIRDLQQKLNLSVVYVTHDQEEAMAVSDRIIVMQNAEIAQVGSPADLYQRPKDAFVAGFIGEANLIPVTPSGHSGQVEINLDKVQKILTLDAPLSPDRQTFAVLRPEAIGLSPNPGSSSLQVTVKKATYLGSHCEYTLTTAVGDIFILSHDAAFTPQAGESCFATIGDQGLCLVQ